MEEEVVVGRIPSINMEEGWMFWRKNVAAGYCVCEGGENS